MEEGYLGEHCTPYYLAELRANLQAEDRIKALVLLSYFPSLAPALQHRALFELSRHTSDFAVALLGHLLANLALLGAIAAAVRSVLLEKIIDQPARLLTLLACLDYKDKTAFIELAAELQTTAMGTDSALACLILDALATAQDSLALSKLSEALRSPHARIRNHAKTVLHRLGPKVVPLLIENLCYADDADLLIHSLNVLGAIGDSSAAVPIRQLLRHEPRDPNVRFAAYEALGLLPLHKGAFMLAEGLADPVEHVRIAAAGAIERHANEIILAGIKNLLAQDDTQASHTVVALLQAEADVLVVHLLDDPTFQRLAVSYLETAAHPALRLHFDRLLRQHGYSAIAPNICLCKQAPREKGRGLIYAVDDSRMMLQIYQNSLHQLGFTSVLFEFPASALAQVCQAKPDVLLTDLNMPEITGLELTTRLRALYTPKQLKIILIKTQQDQITQDSSYAAGVSAMLPKPFTVEQLGIVLQGLM